VMAVSDDDDGDAGSSERIHHLLRACDEREVRQPRIVETFL
jgi:hypothetical protein